MSSTPRKPPPTDFDDNPEWTQADFARSRPAREVLGPEFMAKARRGLGRPPAERHKVPVSIRLDAEVVAQLRARGPGWQTRVNDALTRLLADGDI